MAARTRDRREGGRVNVYLSPEGMQRLDRLAGYLFPGRQRTDGLVVEAALAALERELSDGPRRAPRIPTSADMSQ